MLILGRIKDISNQRFGNLIALRLATPEERSKYKSRHAIWFCQCDCGNTCLVSGTDLRTSKQVSCGCKKKERMIQ